MILSKDNGIKVLVFNYNGSGTSRLSTLSDYVKYLDATYTSYDYTWKQYSNRCSIFNADYTHIYLNSADTISQLISQKRVSTLGSAKKIHFAPTCKYPRFKVSASFPNIKRCLDPSKADIGIISKDLKLNTFKIVNTLMSSVTDDVIIGYSKSSNCYIYLDLLPARMRFTSDYSIFSQLLTKENKGVPVTTKLELWNVLVNYGTIPKDTQITHNGQIVLLSEKEASTVECIENKYMKIIYDTDLDQVINSGSPIPSEEDFKSLNGMLSSTDEAVVGMGLKLLNSYNIQERLGTTTVLLFNNWGKIRLCSTSKSVGFNNVLSTLGITVQDLNRYSLISLLPKVYKNCINEDDRQGIRQRCVEYVLGRLENASQSYKEEFKDLNLNIEVSVC